MASITSSARRRCAPPSPPASRSPTIRAASSNFRTNGSAKILNPIGVAFSLSNSNSRVTYNGDITKSTAGPAISIDNHDGGSVKFQSGSLVSDGASSGIVVQNSNGGSIGFTQPTEDARHGRQSGGHARSTNTGSGDVTSTRRPEHHHDERHRLQRDRRRHADRFPPAFGTANTITTTTGTALNVTNTTIRARGRDVSGASPRAPEPAVRPTRSFSTTPRAGP